ncbi:hypothetical protein EON79_09005 [bacterium]|nr:MAG: hypothetical protein EON79_09005 [bacterium]
MKKPSRRLTVGLATFVTTALLGGTIYWMGGQSAETRFEAQMTRAKALGLSEKEDEIWPPPRDPRDDAAPFYTAFGKAATFRAAAKATPYPPAYPANEVEMRAIRTVLDSVAADLADLEEIAKLPECRFRRTYASRTSDTDSSVFYYAMRLLCQRALCEAAGGAPVRAMRSLTLAARVAAQSGQESDHFAKIRQSGFEAMIVKAAEEILGDSGRRADVRVAARGMLAAFGPLPDMKDGFRVAWYTRLHFTKDLRKDGIVSGSCVDTMSWAYDATGGKRQGYERASFALAMETRAGRTRLATRMARYFLDCYEAVPDDPLQTKTLYRLAKEFESPPPTAGVEEIVARRLTTNLAMDMQSGATLIIRRRLFAALLNALDTPLPPKTLPLAGKEAIDPYSGQPYRYQAQEDGIQIWSVGFDGGEERSASDIAVLWPRPKTRPKMKTQPPVSSLSR